MPFARRGAHWDISSAGLFFKRACAALPAKGSTVGQLAIELQPLLCGGVGQIRPHNCLRSQTGTAASLRPLKPATDCCSFGGAICGDLAGTVIVEQFYLYHCWGVGGVCCEWMVSWLNQHELTPLCDPAAILDYCANECWVIGRTRRLFSCRLMAKTPFTLNWHHQLHVQKP